VFATPHSKNPVKLSLPSYASDNRLLRLYQNGSKSPENQGFPGFCYISGTRIPAIERAVTSLLFWSGGFFYFQKQQQQLEMR